MKKTTVYTQSDPLDYLRMKYGEKGFEGRFCPSSSRYRIKPTGGKQIDLTYMPVLNKIGQSQLGVIMHVKAMARRIENYIPPTDPFFYSGEWENRLDTDIIHAVEIDIKEAYWRSAYLNNAVSEEMYSRYSNQKGDKKLARNAAIGLLNSKKKVVLLSQEPEDDELIRSIEPHAPNVYRKICHDVCNVIRALSEETPEPIFYWVDQVYVSPGVNEKRIVDAVRELGHEVTFKKAIVTRNKTNFIVKTDEGFRSFPRTGRL